MNLSPFNILVPNFEFLTGEYLPLVKFKKPFNTPPPSQIWVEIHRLFYFNFYFEYLDHLTTAGTWDVAHPLSA